MKSLFRWLAVPLAVLGLTLAAADVNQDQIKQAVETVLTDQNKAWNEGDLMRFMEGYARSEKMRFASDGKVLYGWQAALERYKTKYPDRAAMGKLEFSELDITVLSPDSALAFGRWMVAAQGKEFGGLFTLLFRKTDAGWKIVHDHTSSAKD